MSKRDELFLSILRSTYTQDVSFSDRESRRPFDSFIDPLLRWIDAIQRHPHTSLSEYQGRNNCLPPKELEFSHRRELPTSVAAQSDLSNAKTNDSMSRGPAAIPVGAQKAAFLVRWHVNHFAEGAVEDTCIVVYSSGLYHMEKSTQSYGGKLKLHAFEQTLQTPDLEQLGSLLNEPKLKASTHRNLAERKVFREGTITTLEVSRADRVQQLSFADYFGVPGWVSNVNAGTDSEERVITPLRKWLEAHVKAKKDSGLQNPVATHCLPKSMT